VGDFAYRLVSHGSDIMLAISDIGLLGMELEENGLRLHVSRDFYHGSVCSKNKAKQLIRDATIINAVGEGIVALLVEENVVEKKNVLYVQGVPHAQVVRV